MSSQWPEPGLPRAHLAWLLAIAVVVFAGIGLRYPWPADEPRFAQIAREMVESGQWLFPTRGAEYYPDKPPVFVWLSALAYQLVGNLKLSFLLPSALAALGTLWLVYDLGRRYWNAQTALFAVLLLAFTPQFLLQAKAAQIDALVTFWITLGCYGFLRHFFGGPHWGWYLLSWAAMALGIMTKGVGFLPLLMLLPLALWARQPAGAEPAWRWRALWGWAVMAGVIGLWLGPMLYQVQAQGTPELAAYRDDLLFRQTGERFVNAWHHVKPWHYFFTQAIPVVWFPLPIVMLVLWRPLLALLRSDTRARVLLCWVGLVLLFFSLSSGKREVYIFPALPMLALVLAALWAQARETPQASGLDRFFRWLVPALALAVAGLGLFLWASEDHLPGRLQEYPDVVEAIDAKLVLLGLGLALLLVLLRRRDLFVRLATASLAGWLFVALLVWPRVDPHRTPLDMMQRIDAMLPPNAELGLLYFKEQHLLFSSRPLTHFSYLAPIEQQDRNGWAWMHEAPQRYLLVPTDARLSCFDLSRTTSLGEAHRREWVLLGPESQRPSCEAPDRVQRYVYRPVTEGVLH